MSTLVHTVGSIPVSRILLESLINVSDILTTPISLTCNEDGLGTSSWPQVLRQLKLVQR
jgi:hypothetical protein